MDDGRSTRIRYRGRAVDVAPGETLAQALGRGRFPVLQRSIRYHRPRAPFCGVGACSGCLLRVNGTPNVRSCRYLPSPGDEVRTENAWPSPEHDLFGLLDRVFGRGLDTLHGFRRPSWLAPVYHRVIRRLAGFGHLPTDRPGAPVPGRRIETDALVIGAGPSGRAAARTLAAAGVPTTVVDRAPAIPEVPGAERLPSTMVVFLPPPDRTRDRPFRAVAVRDGREAIDLRARRVVVATGGYDGPLLFEGSDRPGVVTAEGALALAAPARPPPFRRAVVFGGGPRAADLLERFGDAVEAVVAPGRIEGLVAERASALSVPLYPRTLLLGARGRRRVRAVVLRRRGDADGFTVEADAVVLAHRRLPHPQLFFQAGARMRWRAGAGAYFPESSPDDGTSVPGLFAAGTAAGVLDRALAAPSGAAAAEAALGRPWAPDRRPPRVPDDVPAELEGYYRELLAGRPRGGKWVICACEDVLLSEVEEASRAGYRGIEVIKRYTGVGTGLCQGRYCLPDTLYALAIFEGRAPPEVGYITQRPPVLPAPLGALAGLPDGPEAA